MLNLAWRGKKTRTSPPHTGVRNAPLSVPLTRKPREERDPQAGHEAGLLAASIRSMPRSLRRSAA
jgi:hypothetical protein